jgi:hypothetical protein
MGCTQLRRGYLIDQWHDLGQPRKIDPLFADFLVISGQLLTAVCNLVADFGVRLITTDALDKVSGVYFGDSGILSQPFYRHSRH